MKRRGFLQMLGLAPLAAVVASKAAAAPVKAAEDQVLTVTAGPQATWAAPPPEIPAFAESGQVLVTGNEGLEWVYLEPGAGVSASGTVTGDCADPRIARFDPEVGKRLRPLARLRGGQGFEEYNETFDHTLQPVNVRAAETYDRRHPDLPNEGGHLSWDAAEPDVYYVSAGSGIIGYGDQAVAVSWPAKKYQLEHDEMFTHVSVRRNGGIIIREGIFPSGAQRREELHLGFLTTGEHVNSVLTGSTA